MKKVFISGASGGIGGAVAKKFLDNGYTVIAQYNTNESGIKSLIKYAEQKGVVEHIFTVKADLSIGSELFTMIDNLKNRFKYIDVIVNNAGVGLYKLITETSEREWDKIFAVNMKSAYAINNAFIGSMVERQKGKIVNVSSMWGKVGASMEVAYSASKAALIGYTKALAKELALSKINVNCVCPGVIDTAMNARFSEQDINDLKEQTPLGRLGAPQDVAELIWFLSESASDFITGQIITVDGGFTL